MSVIDLRLEYKEASGIISDSDNQVDTYLNRGIKFLDSILYSEKKDNRLFLGLASGVSVSVMPAAAKVIKEVWIQTSTERTKLIKVATLEEMRALLVDSTPGVPTRYCLFGTQINANTRNYDPLQAGAAVAQKGVAGDGTSWQIKEFVTFDDGSIQPIFEILAATPEETSQASDLSFYVNWGDVTFDSGSSRGLMTYPKADQQYYLELFGNFQTPALSNAIPDNWWSLNHSDLVIMAALYCRDRYYRNTAGGLELLNSIMADVKNIQDDGIEESLSNRPCVMQG